MFVSTEGSRIPKFRISSACADSEWPAATARHVQVIVISNTYVQKVIQREEKMYQHDVCLCQKKFLSKMHFCDATPTYSTILSLSNDSPETEERMLA